MYFLGRTKAAKRTAPDIKSCIYYSIIGVLLALSVIATLYPILNTLAIAFNDATDALRGGIYLWPRKWTLTNFTTVLRKQSILTGLWISAARTVTAVVLQLSVTALLAYILSQKKFIFRKQVSFMYTITMYVGGGMIPTYMLYRNLGLMNNFWVYILPSMVSAYNMLVIRTYINGLPDSMQEAAMIDGAGYIRIFIKVIVPLCKPVFATVALFIAVGQWNAWFDTMLFNRMSDHLTTLQYELVKLLSSVSMMIGNSNTVQNTPVQVTTASVRAAATILTCLPIIALYPFLQRYFVGGLTIGGVKE